MHFVNHGDGALFVERRVDNGHEVTELDGHAGVPDAGDIPNTFRELLRFDARQRLSRELPRKDRCSPRKKTPRLPILTSRGLPI